MKGKRERAPSGSLIYQVSLQSTHCHLCCLSRLWRPPTPPSWREPPRRGNLFSCGCGGGDSILWPLQGQKPSSPGHGEKNKNRLCSRPRTQAAWDFSDFSIGKNAVSFGWVAKLVRYECEAANGSSQHIEGDSPSREKHC